VFSEGGTGQNSHSSLLQDIVGQFLAIPADLLDVRENIKRPPGLLAGDALDAVQPLYDDVAAPVKFRHHIDHFVLRTLKRLDTGHLREAAGAGITIGHQLSDLLRQFYRHDTVAQSPSGHGIGF